MKHLKKYNELFDNEDLKSSMLVPYLQGNIDTKELVTNVKKFPKSDFAELITFLINKFPFFEYCFDGTKQFFCIKDKKAKDCYHFHFEDKNISVVFTIIIIKDTYDCAITIIKDGTKSSQSYEMLTLKGMSEVIKDCLVNDLVNNGFTEIMSRTPQKKLWNEN